LTRRVPIPALILAAGRATRLRPFTDHLPKSLLEVGGSAMLERSLRHLIDAGVREVVIVTGFQRDKLRSAVARWQLPVQVSFVHNDDFDSTNNAYSLMLAEEAIAGRSFILLDSDLMYDGAIPRLLIERGTTCLALRRADDLAGEEVKVSLDGARVTGVGKEVPLAAAVGESVGLEVFDAAATAHLFATLRSRVRDQGYIGEYYEASFQQMIEEGTAMEAVDIAPHRAMEIDTAADLALAERTFGGDEAAAAVNGWTRVLAAGVPVLG
jgi:choline kinase